MMNNGIAIKCSSHAEEQASFFCLEQECEAKRYFCVLCLMDKHKKHLNKPVKFFWNQISRDAEAMERSIRQFSKIDLMKEDMIAECEKVKDAHGRDMILSSVYQYFSKINNLCRGHNIKQITFNLHKNRNNDAYILNLFYNYCIDWHKNYELNVSPQPNFTRILNIIIEELHEKYLFLQEGVKKDQNSVNLAQIFITDNSSKKFNFSSKLIHNSLSFIDKKKVTITNYADNNYMVLCEPKLSFHKSQQITFKMNNLSSYITVGVCNLNQVNGNFQFMSSGLGHGTYQISSDGYSWSDTDSSVNEQYTTFHYSQGDSVTLEFNPKIKKLKYLRNKQSTTNPLNYELPIDFKKSDQYHFCVSFNSQPEQVQIID